MIPELAQAWRVRQENFPPVIGFDYPQYTLPVSLTGTACALNCAHCGRHYLRHMLPIEAIGNAQSEFHNSPSLLISGGCDAQGRVPVTAHLEAIKSLRAGRRLLWHVGLIEEQDLAAIRPYVDAVSFDFVGDNETIRHVYGLARTVEDYVACYRRLRATVPVVPHITIGLHGGELRGERRALALLRDLGAIALVFLVFIPTPGTRLAGCQPPPVDQVAGLLAEARCLFPDIPLILGCMRPKGAYRAQLDPLAVHAGMNRIVNPAPAAVALAAALGLLASRGQECCVLPLIDHV